MVLRTLPKKLVNQLRKLTTKKGHLDTIYFLGRLKNIDSRGDSLYRLQQLNPHDTASWGGRVRELNVSRQYPNVKSIALKRIHPTSGPPDAKAQIATLRNTVSKHNAQFGNSDYILKKPIAYSINGRIVAMHKVNCPTAQEILELTPKAIKYFEELKAKNPNNEACSLKNLNKKAELVFRRTMEIKPTIPSAHLLVVDFKEGKFVFAPLIDIY